MATQEAAYPTGWRDFLLNSTDQDLLMVAEGQRLNYGSIPIHLHWLDRVSLLLIRQAYLQKHSLALCYPVPVCNLPVLAAAQLLIHDFARNRPGNLSVLLISPRMEVREQYLNLHIRRESLARVLPLARIRADGEPTILSPDGGVVTPHPRLYHLSRPYLLDDPWPKGIGAVIIDHADGTFNERVTQIHDIAARSRIPVVIHLCADPFAAFLETLARAGIPAWVWDHYGLAAEFGEQIAQGGNITHHPFGVSSYQFQHIAAGIDYSLLVCRHPVFEAAAGRVWDDLGTLQRALSNRTSLGAHRALRAAYGIYYALLQMQVPLAVYEEEARNLWGLHPIHRRIADLEIFISQFRDEAPELGEIYWPSLLLDLKEMQEALLAGNPKYDTLVQALQGARSRQKRLSIVCPNQATRRMLQLCLRAREGLQLGNLTEQADDQPIRLVTYSELGTLASSDVIIFPGQFSYSRRQYALTAAGAEVAFLAYSDEADRIEQQLASIHHLLAHLASPERHAVVWSVLAPAGYNAPPPGRLIESDLTTIEITRNQGQQISRRKVAATRQPDLSLWTPFTTSEYALTQEQWAASNEREEPLRPSEVGDAVQQSAVVSALRIQFTDGFCYVEPESLVTVFLPTREQTENRRADSLRISDLILFIDGDQRRQLYETILERIRHHPAMGATYILVRYWQQAVREEFLRSRWTYDTFLRNLQHQGSQMQTTPGIRAWVSGEVLGPSDALDIQRVGAVFGDEALIQEYTNIARALRRLRGLHTSLARKLNRIIVRGGVRSRSPEASEECIDQELNLYLDDFRDSVTLHRIVAIGQERLDVPYIFTGKFFEEGAEVTW
jgi:hypothetical protein